MLAFAQRLTLSSVLMQCSKLTRGSRRRLPAWLALFALLVQVTTSFGHIHAQDFRFLLRGSGTPALLAADGAPDRQVPVLPVDKDCAICASAQLIGNSTLPDAVALVVPGIAELAVPVELSELGLTPPPHLLFTPRGPPLA